MRDDPALILPELGEAERLALAYAPSPTVPAYRAALALDAMLARAALAARESIAAQLRLAWWRDACMQLSRAGEHPVSAALANSWPGDGAALTALIDAWEEIAVGEAAFADRAAELARRRAAVLAICAAENAASAEGAARVWTFAVLAPHAGTADSAAAMRDQIRMIPRHRLPRALRPLAVLEGLARRAAAAGQAKLLGDRLSPLAALRLGILGR